MFEKVKSVAQVIKERDAALEKEHTQFAKKIVNVIKYAIEEYIKYGFSIRLVSQKLFNMRQLNNYAVALKFITNYIENQLGEDYKMSISEGQYNDKKIVAITIYFNGMAALRPTEYNIDEFDL